MLKRLIIAVEDKRKTVLVICKVFMGVLNKLKQKLPGIVP